MISIEPNKKIILDADVIIHFNKADRLGLLTQIYPNKLCLLKDVFNEVFKGDLKKRIENLLSMKLVVEIDFSSDFKVLAEYAKLKKRFGPGESACMAYCKFNKDVLASSNLRDIKTYCEENQIQYLTTMDFLNAAYEKELINEADCDFFIYNVISKGSRLPFKTIAEYRKFLK